MLQTPDLPKGVATVVNVHLEIDASPAAAPGKWMRSFPAFTEIENPVIVASDMNTSGTNGSPTSSHREILNLGNPLIDDLMIPLGSKDLWSMSEPKNDSQFAASYSDPQLARLQFHFRRAYPCSPSSGFFIPQHLRRTRNHGGPAGDQAGFSNGRRVSDDVSDIMLRILSGLYAGPFFRFNFGDGVNTNDVPFQGNVPQCSMGSKRTESPPH